MPGAIEPRPSFGYCTRLPKGEQCVGIVTFHGMVIVATGRGVYRLAQRRKGTYKLVPFPIEAAPAAGTP